MHKNDYTGVLRNSKNFHVLFLDDTVGKTKIHYFENAIYCCENALVTDCVLGNIAQKGGSKKVQFIDSKTSI